MCQHVRVVAISENLELHVETLVKRLLVCTMLLNIDLNFGWVQS